MTIFARSVFLSFVCSLTMTLGSISAPVACAQDSLPAQQADSAKPDAPAEPAAGGESSPQPSQPKTDLGPQASVLDGGVEQLVEKIRPSVVIVRFRGRNNRESGLGSGFIVTSDGLIATNRHVLGDARPIEVELSDGRVFPVTEVHATDRDMDLALVRITAKDLPELPLGDSDQLKQGQPIIAMGNPNGLELSVVAGLIAGVRDIEGQSMIQLHVPIEQGNSGGPVVDLQGRVLGLMTLKNRVTAYLGYAMPVNELRRLIESPNPIPMSKWLTIGQLDRAQWEVLGNANWRQRAGRLHVDGLGEWFGGRSLCLQTADLPALPQELSVEVRLDDEQGAAGLAFLADGGHQHYGFYPTAGMLRLTRFEGPTVSSWRIIEDVRTDHYRRGEWNHLRVRIENDRIRCFINGELIITHSPVPFEFQRFGLVKFRDTSAGFRRFRQGPDLTVDNVTADQLAALTDLVREIDPQRPPRTQLVEQAREVSPRAAVALRDRARQLERQAERLRQLADQLHVRSVQSQLLQELEQPEADCNLLRCALLVASLDNEEIDVDAYLKQVDSLVRDVQAKLKPEASVRQKISALNETLFKDHGFHGSRTNYYHRSNSYLNEVIDDREGLPITLAVLYMEVARRLDLPLFGVGLPGHFVVGWKERQESPEEDPALRLIDVFDAGTELAIDDVIVRVERETARPFDKRFLESQTKRAIVQRILRNLWNVALGQEDRESMLRYTDTLLRIDESSAEHRWFRALLQLQTGRLDEAVEDVDWLLENPSPQINPLEVRQLRQHLRSIQDR